MAAKREEELVVHEQVLKGCFASITDFKHCFTATIRDFDFKPGSFILVLNKKIEAASNPKCKLCYFGPMVVALCSSYCLTKVDGTVSKLKFTAFHLISYLPRSFDLLEVMQFVNHEDQLRTVDIQVRGRGKELT